MRLARMFQSYRFPFSLSKLRPLEGSKFFFLTLIDCSKRLIWIENLLKITNGATKFCKINETNLQLILLNFQRSVLRVDPAPIQAVDQDVGINAPVRYSIQGGILPFLILDPESADIVIARPLIDYELMTPATIVLKASRII